MKKNIKNISVVLLVIFAIGSIGLSIWSVQIITDENYDVQQAFRSSFYDTANIFYKFAGDYKYGSSKYDYYMEEATKATRDALECDKKIKEIETSHYVVSAFAIICYLGTIATIIAFAVLSKKSKINPDEITTNDDNLSEIPATDFQDDEEPENSDSKDESILQEK